MKILWLATDPRKNPSTRFRALLYMEALKASGMEIIFKSLINANYFAGMHGPGHLLYKIGALIWFWIIRLKDVLLAYRFDAVIVLREVFPLGPSFLERLLLMVNHNVIFDFDDALYMKFEQVNNPLDRFRDFQKTRKLIQGSRITVAGSSGLQAYARQYTTQVELIPTVVDIHDYSPKQHTCAGPEAVIGWMGTRNNLHYLSLVEEALIILQKKHGCFFRVVCDTDYVCPGLVVENIRWSESREQELLQSFDIGLMPLPDNDYSRGKCAFKAIHYLAGGIPPVCSPVGENLRVITDGATGYLAKGRDEWLAKIERLIQNPDLRQQMGEQGRKVIEKDYSLETGLARWQKVLSRLKFKGG